MTWVRIVLPAAIAVAGIVLGITVNLALGFNLLIAAALVTLANLWIRLAFLSERDREREQRARDEFGRTGRWPQERRRHE
jgi:membrane protein implicated in regulation of membrane protease activity